MSTTRSVHLAALALFALAVAAPMAQQSDKAKRPPKQTHDKGVDDDPAAAPATRLGEKLPGGVSIEALADGTLVARFDETFHDALVATKGADGKLTYTCVHGLAAAEGKIRAHGPVLTAKPLPEEK